MFIIILLLILNNKTKILTRSIFTKMIILMIKVLSLVMTFLLLTLFLQMKLNKDCHHVPTKIWIKLCLCNWNKINQFRMLIYLLLQFSKLNKRLMKTRTVMTMKAQMVMSINKLLRRTYLHLLLNKKYQDLKKHNLISMMKTSLYLKVSEIIYNFRVGNRTG